MTRWSLASGVLAAAVMAAGCQGSPSIDQSAEPPTSAAANAATTSDRPITTTTAAPSISSTSAPTTEPVTTTSLAPDQRPWPTTADETAAELSQVELDLRSETDPDVAAALGRRQQQLYQVLSANRDWADQAVSQTDPLVRTAVELNWQARVALSALVQSGPLSSTLPAWRVDQPEPVANLLSYYHEAEELTGVGWNYLAAINLVETRMGRINGLSTAGAVGPMQFLPSTWEGCCEGDPNDAHDSIVGAAVYLTKVGAPADMDRALFSYNRSDRYVNAVKAYAEVLALDESAYAGYHAWDVYFASSVGIVRISPGYEEPEPVDAASWLADHPDALLDG